MNLLRIEPEEGMVRGSGMECGGGDWWSQPGISLTLSSSKGTWSLPHTKFPTGPVWAKGWWWEVEKTMNGEAIKSYEVGRGRGSAKSFPLPPCLGLPRCSRFYRLGQRVRSLHLIGNHEWCVRGPKRKSPVNYPRDESCLFVQNVLLLNLSVSNFTILVRFWSIPSLPTQFSGNRNSPRL